MALKLAIDREEMLQKILMRLRLARQRFPINTSYPLFTEIEQRKFDPEKAAFHYKKSGHGGSVLLRTSDVAFPGAVDAAQLYQQSAAKAGITIEVKREPGDGYWSEVWNKQPFSRILLGRPARPRTRCIRPPTIRRPTGTTPASSARTSTRCCSQARAELDQDKRKADLRTTWARSCATKAG